MKSRISFVLLALGLVVFAAASGFADRGAAASGRELPIYVVTRGGVDRDTAAKLQQALRLKGSPLAPDGSLNYMDQRYQSLPLADGASGVDEKGNATAAKKFDFDAIRAIQVPSDNDALRAASAGLRAAGLDVAGAKQSVEHSIFQAVDTDGRSVVNKAIDTQVDYSFSLQGRPVVGPGARAGVAFDRDGAVTRLAYAVREVKPGRSVGLIDQAVADKKAAAAYQAECGPKLAGLQLHSELVYYAPPLSVDARALYPHYRYHADAVVDGQDVPLRDLLVPAAENTPADSAAPLPTRASCGNGRAAAKPTRQAARTRRVQAVGPTDVGAESINTCSGLSNAGADADGFVNRMGSYGIPSQFNFHEWSSWERDFKDPAFGGNDSSYVDDVDEAFYAGHANGNGFLFCSSVDDTWLNYTDARWGDRDLEWLAIAACGPLQDLEGGLWWFQRWKPAFKGLHLLLGYETTSWDVNDEGWRFAEYQLRSPTWWAWWNTPMKVRQAWAQMAIDAQGDPNVRYAAMGVYGTDGSTNYDDYFWGKGTTGPDITSIGGSWKISGPA